MARGYEGGEDVGWYLEEAARLGPGVCHGPVLGVMNIRKRLLNRLVGPLQADNRRLQLSLDKIRIELGRQAARSVRTDNIESIRDVEFPVFSQWGEDGIIQFLTDRVPIDERVFLEIGVESYEEANTRFLLMTGGWRGVIVDAGDEHLRFVREQGLDWRYSLHAVQMFVTVENCKNLLDDRSLSADIGLFSLDIDGNDYWVADTLLPVLRPRIVVVEYNSIFGPNAAVSVPYDPAFARAEAHPSGLYYGCSYAALQHLAAVHDYSVVGSNSAGNNVFMVRSDVADGLPAEEGWVRSAFREARDSSGQLMLIDPHTEGLPLIGGMKVVDVRNNADMTVADAVGGGG